MSERSGNDATRDQDDFLSQEDWDDSDQGDEEEEESWDGEVEELDFGFEFEDHGYRPEREDE